eukprot:CAMPEP_0175144560 /NCGR_PEP_ID=MMETSP0087-20121206/14214_1 /TAXON_ID=136419 /ORGANISM="Unknown Unknown, Strain D1" /LENGTH=114 /DNA_ID=CAMNT_0016429071 /DNA_START=318 /DNA_END=658 /DNA_ORIENTATION=+
MEKGIDRTTADGTFVRLQSKNFGTVRAKACMAAREDGYTRPRAHADDTVAAAAAAAASFTTTAIIARSSLLHTSSLFLTKTVNILQLVMAVPYRCVLFHDLQGVLAAAAAAAAA